MSNPARADSATNDLAETESDLDLPTPAPDGWDGLLDIRQMAALNVLVSSGTVGAAAAAAKVGRNTVTRWIRTCPAFRAAYNAWRQNLIEATQARLLHTAEAAAGVIDEAVRNGDARLAMMLLKYLGLGRGAQPGPTDLKLAEDEVAIIHEEERDVLHARAQKAGNLWISPRKREECEEIREQFEFEHREKATKAKEADPFMQDHPQASKKTP